MIGGAGSTTPDDALSSAITLETQADILRSNALALRVIEILGLENDPDFQPKFNPIDFVLSRISPSGAADPQGAQTLEEQPTKRTRLLRVFSKHLKIELVPGSRLINVSYTSSNPKTAAAVVNKLMKALEEQDGQARHQEAEKASAWVNDQMAGLRDQTDTLQKQLADMQKNSGIFSTGTLDANGHPQEYSEVLDHLQQLSGQLMQAEQGRILKGAVYAAAKSDNGEILSGLVGNSIGNGLSANTAINSLSLIQSLRDHEAELESQIDQDKVKFGPAYPKLAEEKASLAGIQAAIRDETARLGDRARSDFEIAQSTENSIRRQYNSEKAKADTLNDKAVQYTIARQEADDTRSLYDDMQKSLQEAGIVAGLGSTSFTVVDRGLVPSLPKWPNPAVFLALATFGGVFLGTFLAVIIDLLDAHVKAAEELECHGNLIGLVPGYAMARDPSRYWHALQSDSRFLDAVQVVSFGIANARGEPPSTVLVCSALPREGKTVLSIALANYYAQQGLNVLLVETNIKVPKLATFTNLSTAHTASSAGAESLATEFTQAPAVPNLSLIPGDRLNGRSFVQPSLIHMREQINAWRNKFDVIVIDGPAVLNSQGWLSICSATDHVIYVARHRKTTLAAASRTVSVLSRLRDVPVSLVMTDVNEKSSEFKHYYGIYSARQLTKGLKYEEA